MNQLRSFRPRTSLLTGTVAACVALGLLGAGYRVGRAQGSAELMGRTMALAADDRGLSTTFAGQVAANSDVPGGTALGLQIMQNRRLIEQNARIIALLEAQARKR